MAAPGLTFSISGNKISDEAGFDYIIVTFQSDIPYQSFECRATKIGDAYGVGKGALIASFSTTPANTQRTFEVYDDYLLHGDGSYRISLFAQGEDGSWNDNYGFIPSGETETMITSDGEEFYCMRDDSAVEFTDLLPLATHFYWINTGGGHSGEDKNWISTDKIEVKPGWYVDYKILGHTLVASLAVYDENQRIFDYVKGTSENVLITGVYTIPDNAKYLTLTAGSDTWQPQLTSQQYVNLYTE